MEYELVIGLETHAHFLTGSKMFCGCSTKVARALEAVTEHHLARPPLACCGDRATGV